MSDIAEMERCDVVTNQRLQHRHSVCYFWHSLWSAWGKGLLWMCVNEFVMCVCVSGLSTSTRGPWQVTGPDSIKQPVIWPTLNQINFNTSNQITAASCVPSHWAREDEMEGEMGWGWRGRGKWTQSTTKVKNGMLWRGVVNGGHHMYSKLLNGEWTGGWGDFEWDKRRIKEETRCRKWGDWKEGLRDEK